MIDDNITTENFRVGLVDPDSSRIYIAGNFLLVPPPNYTVIAMDLLSRAVSDTSPVDEAGATGGRCILKYDGI